MATEDRETAASASAIESARRQGIALLDELVECERVLRQAEARRSQLLVRAVEFARRHVDVFTATGVVEDAQRAMTAEVACALGWSHQGAASKITEALAAAARAPRMMERAAAGDVSMRHVAGVVRELEGAAPSVAQEVDQQMANVVEHTVAAGQPVAMAGFAAGARRRRSRMDGWNQQAQHRAAVTRRCVGMDLLADGMATLWAYVPAASAVAMMDRLAGIARAAERTDDSRTAPQMRADALIELVLTGGPDDEHSAAASDAPGAQGDGAGVELQGVQSVPWLRWIHPTVVVTVPMTTLLGGDDGGELAGYGPIDSATARELASLSPTLYRMLVDPTSGEPADQPLDRKYRVTGSLRKFLQARDVTCRFPGCTRTAAFCEVDHTVDWANGGKTEPNNLAHLCPVHHHLKHESGWTVQNGPEGSLIWHSPSGLEYHASVARPDIGSVGEIQSLVALSKREREAA